MGSDKSRGLKERNKRLNESVNRLSLDDRNSTKTMIRRSKKLEKSPEAQADVNERILKHHAGQKGDYTTERRGDIKGPKREGR